MPSITPATRVAELLEHWPELEPVLIAQAPAFAKLKNPVLRRTIARVATLEQAAAIAGLSARDLVLTLRRAAGQDVGDVEPGAGEVPASPSSPCAATPVASAEAGGASVGTQTIDVDALLEAGEVPLKAVFDAAGRLEPGESLRVVASFRPIPLMDRLEDHGYRCTVDETEVGRVVVYVTKE